MLTERGFRVLCGGRHPDGTDGVLLRQARRLRRKRKIGQFVLASNDCDFTRVTAYGSLHVVTLDPACLSLRLRSRASTVTVLMREPSGWRIEMAEPS